jgi:hypothetical protein
MSATGVKFTRTVIKEIKGRIASNEPFDAKAYNENMVSSHGINSHTKALEVYEKQLKTIQASNLKARVRKSKSTHK